MKHNSLMREKSLKNIQLLDEVSRKRLTYFIFKPSDPMDLYPDRPRFIRRARWRLAGQQ